MMDSIDDMDFERDLEEIRANARTGPQSVAHQGKSANAYQV
jgi:hypothetical protein